MLRPLVGVFLRITEELEEGGGEEGVGEFEGVAAGAAQPVRLLQSPRDPLLLGQLGQRDRVSRKSLSVTAG